jgi:hypothetical protein
LLIGTRGKFPAPLQGTQPRKLTKHPVREHSQKPDFHAEQIERLWPGVPKLEMFCRSPRPGWDAWGYEATNPVANAGEGANGAIAVASDDPASRDADGADRQQSVASGFTGGDDGRDVEAIGGATPVITIQSDPVKRVRSRKVMPA